MRFFHERQQLFCGFDLAFELRDGTELAVVNAALAHGNVRLFGTVDKLFLYSSPHKLLPALQYHDIAVFPDSLQGRALIHYEPYPVLSRPEEKCFAACARSRRRNGEPSQQRRVNVHGSDRDKLCFYCGVHFHNSKIAF
ncbi:Uncharacterised protein [uncultured archaeon]|nr:Uncharacterised protein [uncultured archaeon]